MVPGCYKDFNFVDDRFTIAAMIDSSSEPKPELFFGLVGAVGTDLDKVSSALSKSLTAADYQTETIRLSKMLRDVDKYKDLPTKYTDDYIDAHMTAGDEFRRIMKRPDAVALLGVGNVKEIRASKGKTEGKILSNQAYIFRSLKNPGEVESLRKIYGSSFHLIAAYTSRQDRRVSLAKRIATTRNLFPYERHFAAVDKLIDRDQEEIGDKNGQNTRDSFHRADLFVDTGSPEKLEQSVGRFVELLLGYPFHTPTREEYGMFHAQAAALRSAELGRQVGAAIATQEGDIITVGCNEVPKAGGGLYWCGDTPDNREYRSGVDGIEEQKRNLIAETLQVLKEKGWLEKDKTNLSTDELVALALDPENPVLTKDLKIRSLIEFGRAVHGEMAALTDAAKRGVSVNKCIMLVTTFPCHLCARHIVTAGISKVIYIEPYAKSLAAELYPDSISDDGDQNKDCHVPFVPFVGIAPRQYMNLFANDKRKNPDGTIVVFSAKNALPKFTLEATVYLENEVKACRILHQTMKKNGFVQEGDNDGVVEKSIG
jgi:cytidine deaminase